MTMSDAAAEILVTETGLVTNIQKFSLEDGPGIRTTVFLKGCPLHCAWCHNPENVSPRPEVVVFESRCVRCGQCAEACPQGNPVAMPAVPASGGPPDSPSEQRLTPEDRSRCTLCEACVAACPTGARQVMGRQMRVTEVLKEVLADRVFYEESRGGVTFSGGEPLRQHEFLKAALEAFHYHGIHTAVDTCGFAPREHLLGIAPLVDLFLYDLKLMDDQRHQEYTGVSNQLILENLKALNEFHDNIWLRIPLIPGVNDRPADLQALARFAASLLGVQQVNLLPYHRTGVPKFRRLGLEYQLPEVAPPSTEGITKAAAAFAALGLKVKTGG